MSKQENNLKGSFVWINQNQTGEYFSATYKIHVPWWRKILNFLGFKKDHTTIIG